MIEGILAGGREGMDNMEARRESGQLGYDGQASLERAEEMRRHIDQGVDLGLKFLVRDLWNGMRSGGGYHGF